MRDEAFHRENERRGADSAATLRDALSDLDGLIARNNALIERERVERRECERRIREADRKFAHSLGYLKGLIARVR